MKTNSLSASVRPFLKWAGGKTQLIPSIEQLLPPSFCEEEICYVEPFVGGGALLFYLLKKYHNIKNAVINDINSRLINTYLAIKYHPKDLIFLLKDLQISYMRCKSGDRQKMLFLDIRQKFNFSSLGIIEEAAYMIFLNHTCFNGLYRENSRGEFNVAFGKYVNPVICDESLIFNDSELLQRVKILNGDFSQVVDYVEQPAFVYFDPPYRPINNISFTSYSKENFNDKEQQRLKHFIDYLTTKGISILLSNSDGSAVDPENTYLDMLYKDYFINRVYARRSISRNGLSRGPIPELLIRNYRIDRE